MPKRRASVFLRHPLGTLAGIFVVLGWGTVAVNAVFLQDGPHPAPLIAPAPTGEVPADATSMPQTSPATPQISAAERQIVEDLQRALSLRGFYEGPVDGLPGERTRAAIRDYQRAAGLEETGRHSEALIARIELSSIGVPLPPDGRRGDGAQTQDPDGQDENASRDEGAPVDMTALIESAADPAGPQGDPVVESVQRVLADLGYAPGDVDGQLGPTTRAAIRRFEEDRGLAPTGDMGDRFLRELEAVSGEALG